VADYEHICIINPWCPDRAHRRPNRLLFRHSQYYTTNTTRTAANHSLKLSILQTGLSQHRSPTQSLPKAQSKLLENLRYDTYSITWSPPWAHIHLISLFTCYLGSTQLPLHNQFIFPINISLILWNIHIPWVVALKWADMGWLIISLHDFGSRLSRSHSSLRRPRRRFGACGVLGHHPGGFQHEMQIRHLCLCCFLFGRWRSWTRWLINFFAIHFIVHASSKHRTLLRWWRRNELVRMGAYTGHARKAMLD
jgi:hypothetical protein